MESACAGLECAHCIGTRTRGDGVTVRAHYSSTAGLLLVYCMVMQESNLKIPKCQKYQKYQNCREVPHFSELVLRVPEFDCTIHSQIEELMQKEQKC